MLIISDPLSAQTLKDYHREEFTNPARAYYMEGSQLQGFWHGRLAEELGLSGGLQDEQFDRALDGKDPLTGEQVIGYRSGKAVEDGREMDHRAGYDFVFSAPKSVSITAFVGGDTRILEFHRAAVKEAADYGERFVQMRMGGNLRAETTGKWLAAGFEHSTSRPVDGYAAPQLHTHLVVMNMTAYDGQGRARAIEPSELYRLQSAMSRVYQNRLHAELEHAGYEIIQGKNHAPEIKGYTREYLESESQRSIRIDQEMKDKGLTGRNAALLVSQNSREDKLALSPAAIYQQWRGHGTAFGQPSERVIEEARERARHREHVYQSPERAVTWAIERLSERHSVIERDGYKHRGGIVQNALEYAQGKIRLQDVEAEIGRRKVLTEDDRQKGYLAPELVTVHHYRDHAPGERFATRAALGQEREIIAHVISRQGQYERMADTFTRDEFRQAYRDQLTNKQMWMVWNAMHSTDQITGVQGVAGSGKSFAMRTLAMIARDHGYLVRGITPTSSARKELEANGIESVTLAKHTHPGYAPPRTGRGQHRLYIVDEASLVSTKSFNAFLRRLEKTDRVLVVGDTGQHHSIEAGSPFAQLQDAGMQTIKLDTIMRQRENPDLLLAVQLAERGRIGASVRQLDSMGVIQQVAHKEDRLKALARRFAQSPGNSLILNVDNATRKEIHQAVRQEMKATGDLGTQDVNGRALVARNDLLRGDTLLARSYDLGDYVRAEAGDKRLKIKVGEYLEVIGHDLSANMLHVRRSNGRVFTYDPEKHDLNASVYRTEALPISVGERLQLTNQWKEKGLATREMGTVESLDKHGNVALRMSAPEGRTGRVVHLNLRDFPHLDYAYSMTSYSSQSMTVRNVLVHIDTADTRVRELHDRVSAYVGFSRASHHLEIFTDRKEDLVKSLDRAEERPSALSREQVLEYRPYAREVDHREGVSA